MTDELTLKAWAINASRNPYDEHQKAHADATLKLIEERDSLRAALEEAHLALEKQANGGLLFKPLRSRIKQLLGK